MPLCLSPGWNQIQFNLADFVRRAYGTNYVETVRIQMHANVLLRRIFFTDRLYAEDEKPAEYRLFKSIQKRSEKVPFVKPTKISKQEPVARPASPIKQTEISETAESHKEVSSYHELDTKEDFINLKGVEFEPEDKPLIKEDIQKVEIEEALKATLSQSSLKEHENLSENEIDKEINTDFEKATTGDYNFVEENAEE